MRVVICAAVLSMGWAALASSPKATQLAKEGDRLYKDGKYREAAEALKQAYELDKTPVFLFNMARAHDQAGDLQIALDTYRQYVSLPDTDPQLVKRANLAMDRLRALVAKGEADRQVQEAESRRLKEEAEAARKKADEEASRARRQQEEFEARETARKRQQSEGAGARKITGIVLGALAVGALGAGVAFGLLANNAKSSFLKATTLADKQRLEKSTQQWALIADLCLGGALAFAITFAIVFPWSSPGGSEVRVAVSGSSLAIGGSF